VSAPHEPTMGREPYVASTDSSRRKEVEVVLWDGASNLREYGIGVGTNEPDCADDDHEDHDPQATARTVAPAAAVRPRRPRAEQAQDENDQEDSAEAHDF